MRCPRFCARLRPSAVRVRIRSEAVPALAAALKDHNQYFRKLAAAALMKIGPAAAEAVPALAAALKDPDETVRRFAASALRDIGPAAVPTLAAALKDPTNLSGQMPPPR
jgi:HEAT repeat protein